MPEAGPSPRQEPEKPRADERLRSRALAILSELMQIFQDQTILQVELGRNEALDPLLDKEATVEDIRKVLIWLENTRDRLYATQKQQQNERERIAQQQQIRNLVDEFVARYERAYTAYDVLGLSRAIKNNPEDLRAELRLAKQKWAALHPDRLRSLEDATLAALATECNAVAQGAITWIERNAFIDEVNREKISQYIKPPFNQMSLEATEGENKPRSFLDDYPIKFYEQIPVAELVVGDFLMLKTDAGEAYICKVESIRNNKLYIQFVAGVGLLLGSEGSLSDRFIVLRKPLRFRLESGEVGSTSPIVELIISKHFRADWTQEAEENQQREMEYQQALREISEATTLFELRSKLEALKAMGFAKLRDASGGMSVPVESQLVALGELERRIFDEGSWNRVSPMFGELTSLGKIREKAQVFARELFGISRMLRFALNPLDISTLLDQLRVKGQVSLIDFDGMVVPLEETAVFLKKIYFSDKTALANVVGEVSRLPIRFGIRQKVAAFLERKNLTNSSGKKLFEMRPYDVELTSFNIRSLLPGEYITVATKDGSTHTFQAIEITNGSLPVVRHYASVVQEGAMTFEGVESPLLNVELKLGQPLFFARATTSGVTKLRVSLVPPKDVA